MKLYLYTATFPTGFGESFLNNEIPGLEKVFAEIILCPLQLEEKKQTAYVGDHKIVYHKNDYLNTQLSFADSVFILRILLIEFFAIRQKGFFIKKLRRFYAMTKKAMRLSKWLKNNPEIDANAAHYSFWMNEWAFALAILNKRYGKPNFLFRINGYDIYDERHEGDYLPFRHFIYSHCQRVVPLSKTSEAYVKTKTRFPEKVISGYFGTKDFGIAQPKNGVFTIFTCSMAIPLKRLDKIAESIALLPFPTKWIHHGDGPSMETIRPIIAAFPDHIKFVHSGKKENYFEVLEFQREAAPDLFINLSTTEGLPVTIMETLSFGTPVLVNDVGSCAEFITPFTGILVASDEVPASIAKKIAKFNDPSITQFSRDKIRRFWEENFSAEKNYEEFARSIKQIFNGIKR